MMLHRCVVILTLSLLLSASVSPAATYSVDCNEGADYLTIQEAVDVAANGDTILVAACVYEERVSILGKNVTILGEGWETTEITTTEVGFTVFFDERPPGDVTSRMSDISVTNTGSLGRCVRIAHLVVALERCRIDDVMQVGDEDPANVEVSDCVIGDLSVGGLGARVFVHDSQVGRLVAGGGYDGTYWWGHAVSASNTIGTLLVTGGVADSQSDEVDLVQYEGHLDCYSTLNAVDGSFDELLLNGVSDVSLERCEMESIVYHPDIEGYLVMDGCLVLGDFRAVFDGSYGALLEVALTHNTILGDLTHVVPECAVSGDVFSNIIMGSIDIAEADWLELRTNDILGEINAPGATLIDNINDDPLFCDEEADDYTLQDCSPCLGAAHDGGDIGAFGVGCDCDVAVEDSSWGRIKHLFRD
jgi:hypothetical protein